MASANRCPTLGVDGANLPHLCVPKSEFWWISDRPEVWSFVMECDSGDGFLNDHKLGGIRI